MTDSQFLVGQRAFVSSLNANHSIYKKQRFLGRVVTVINVRKQKNGFRYFIQLATDKRYTMFILEKHLSHLTNQELHPTDKVNLYVDRANEVPQFDEKRLPMPSEKELLWVAYMALDHGSHDERLAVLDKLKNHFECVGKSTSRS